VFYEIRADVFLDRPISDLACGSQEGIEISDLRQIGGGCFGHAEKFWFFKQACQHHILSSSFFPSKFEHTTLEALLI
jgi:hypothetical protein